MTIFNGIEEPFLCDPRGQIVNWNHAWRETVRKHALELRNRAAQSPEEHNSLPPVMVAPEPATPVNDQSLACNAGSLWENDETDLGAFEGCENLFFKDADSIDDSMSAFDLDL
jgi:hypothetical protein